MSRINPGHAGCEVSKGKWKKALNSYLDGKKITLATPHQKNPWIQLNLKRPLEILAVTICLHNREMSQVNILIYRVIERIRIER